MRGFFQDGTLMRWRWIKEGIVMFVGALGTWPIIVGIGDREEEWQRIGDWNMEREESREFMNNWTI